MRKTAWALAGALGMALTGCALKKDDDDLSRFREAIPQPDAVSVPGPETAARAAQAGSGADRRGFQSHDSSSVGGPWAKYYGLTREVRDGVNHITGSVLGAVWILVHTHPTSVDGEQATWGPYTDALEPATWRFRNRAGRRS